MPTYANLADDILIELDRLGAGETADPNDSALVLSRLTGLRDTWNAQRLLVYEVRQEVFTLIVGLSDYTIGPSGNFLTTRPVKIENAVLIDTTITPNQRYPQTVIDKDAWVNRWSVQPAQFPAVVYYEPAYPNGIVHLGESPTTVFDIELSTWQPWTTVLTLTTLVTLPPAYYEMVLYNGALRLANAFGVQPTALLVQFARESRAVVKSLNSASPRMTTDVPRGLSH